MKRQSRNKWIFIVLALAISCAMTAWASNDVPYVAKEELKAMLDDPAVVVLDVRTGRDWQTSEFKIKGAVYANPSDYSAWAKTYPKDKTLVLYCA